MADLDANADLTVVVGRLAQALESFYRDRYGPVAARYIVECIAEGKDYSDVLPRLDVPPEGGVIGAADLEDLDE